MTTKNIEEQIREHYTAQNGEWLVEKGKVKEAKLLKEACLYIEAARRELARLREEKHSGHWQNVTKEREMADREKAVAEREKRFEERKADFITQFEKWV